MFIGLLLAAWADGFAHVGWPTLVALGVLTLLSLLVDVLATVVGAQRVGASRKALWGTFVGSIVGLFFMPIGLFAGPLVGALLGEYWHTRELLPLDQGRSGHLARHPAWPGTETGGCDRDAGPVRVRLVLLSHLTFTPRARCDRA